MKGTKCSCLIGSSSSTFRPLLGKVLRQTLEQGCANIGLSSYSVLPIILPNLIPNQKPHHFHPSAPVLPLNSQAWCEAVPPVPASHSYDQRGHTSCCWSSKKMIKRAHFPRACIAPLRLEALQWGALSAYPVSIWLSSGLSSDCIKTPDPSDTQNVTRRFTGHHSGVVAHVALGNLWYWLR